MNLPLGYRYAATFAGIRKVAKDDLALIVSDTLAAAAAVFTKNRVVAAPVAIARKHLAADAITIDAAEIVTAAKAHLGANALAEDLHVWSQALRDELDGVTLTVVMSWPDEQPAAEQDGNKPSAPPPGLPCRATDMHNGDRHHCTVRQKRR